jgi:hypothetical protein
MMDEVVQRHAFIALLASAAADTARAARAQQRTMTVFG